MTDISKCRGLNCPLKEKCHRATVKANPFWQSYTPYYINDGECKHFICNRNR